MDLPHRVSSWLGTVEIWDWPDLGVAVSFVGLIVWGFWLVRQERDS